MVLTGNTSATPHARPAARIAAGLLLAFAAIRVNGFDLLLDPVGWWLCATGADRLRGGDAPGRVAVAMACLSVVALFASGTSAGTLIAVSVVGEAPPLAESGSGDFVFGVVHSAAALVTLWTVVDVVIVHVREGGEVTRAALLDALRWVATGAGGLAVLAALGYGRLAEAAVVVAFAALAVLIVLLLRIRVPHPPHDDSPHDDSPYNAEKVR